MIIVPFINKIKINKLSNIWKITDQIIKIRDVNEDVIPDFSSRFNITDTYTCMRDMELNTTSIFIKSEDVEKFKKIRMIYDRDKDLVNLTLLKKYVLKKDAYCSIADKVVPQAVNIKLLYYINIMDINIYVQTVFRLQQDATLFKELLEMKSPDGNFIFDLKERK